MASIGPVTLDIVPDVANVDITVTYTLTGSDSDIAALQRYTESWRLIGDDTGIFPLEDNIDDPINLGVILLPGSVVFPDSTPIQRVRKITIPKSNLNEDVGLDEIRAVVSLTPVFPSSVTRESDQVKDTF